MVTSDRDDDSGVGPRAVAAAVGGLLGAAVGGPGGAVLGSAGGVVLEPLLDKVWMELHADVRRRAARVVELASAAAGEPVEAFTERMTATEESRLFSGATLSAATRTVYGPKIEALARVLAAGLADDCARIDVEQLFVAALADIEAPNLVVLDLLVHYRAHNALGRATRADPWEKVIESPQPWSVAEISTVRPTLAEPLVLSLLGPLERHGLIRQDLDLAKLLEKYGSQLAEKTRQHERNTNSGGVSQFNNPTSMDLRKIVPPAKWVATPHGVELLRLIEDVAD